MIRAGEMYQYRLDAVFLDGSRITSPVRLFGLSRTNAVAISLTGSAFQAGTSLLTQKARHILNETASLLREYPNEKIVIEGHADIEGSSETNRELAKKRSEATADYLVREGKIDKDRVVVRWFGMDAAVRVGSSGNLRSDGRVEIKGEAGNAERLAIFDQHRTTPSVRINRIDVAVDNLGRFSHTLPGETGRIDVEMADDHGRSVQTAVTLPAITLLDPAGEVLVPFSGQNTMPGNGSAEDARLDVSYTVRGKTEVGNVLELNNERVKIEPDGTFSVHLRLRDGENIFWLKITSPEGYNRYTKLTVTVALKKDAPKVEPEMKETFLDRLVKRIIKP
jgi:hypothetical protein